MPERTNNLLLLGCLLNNQDLMHTAVQRLGEYQLFDRMKDPASAFLWTVMAECYKACGDRIPTELMLRAELENRLQVLPEFGISLKRELAGMLAALGGSGYQAADLCGREGLSRGRARRGGQDHLDRAYQAHERHGGYAQLR